MKSITITNKLAELITALIENIPVNEKSARNKWKVFGAVPNQRDDKKKISVAIL
jgi:hypothetical protein